MNSLGGTITFSIIGAYCEEFINDLINNKINLKNINSRNGIIYADTGTSQYPYIARKSKKYGVRTRVTKRHGIYFKIRGFSKRPGLIIGIIASAVLVNVLRLYIWNIVIHNNNGLTDDYILGVLENYGITAGTLANDSNTLETERRIMLTDDNINWINIEINGSRADVYLSENSVNEKIDFMTPCNLIASHTGVIVDSEVASGNMLYEIGSGVAEGSVIVSGTVSSGDSTILVHSEAKVIAEFYDDAVFSMDYKTVENIPTGETFTHRQIMLLGMVFPMDSNNSNISDTICTEQTEQCTLWGVELPIKIKTETYTKYIGQEITRKEDDVRRILDSRLELYKLNFLNKYEILDIEKIYDFSENGGTLKAHIKLRGDITVTQPIYEH